MGYPGATIQEQVEYELEAVSESLKKLQALNTNEEFEESAKSKMEGELKKTKAKLALLKVSASLAESEEEQSTFSTEFSEAKERIASIKEFIATAQVTLFCINTSGREIHFSKWKKFQKWTLCFYRFSGRNGF